jgi:hypothetical protein
LGRIDPGSERRLARGASSDAAGHRRGRPTRHHRVLVYYAIVNAAAVTLPAEQRRWPRTLHLVGITGCVVLIVTLPLTACSRDSPSWPVAWVGAWLSTIDDAALIKRITPTTRSVDMFNSLFHAARVIRSVGRFTRSKLWRRHSAAGFQHVGLRSAGVVIAVGALFAGGCASPATPSPAGAPHSSIDWNAVGRAMGSPLKTEEGDVHIAEFLRSDLQVVNAGVTENPGMELGAEAMFHQTPVGTAVMIGEATVTDQELNKVLARLEQDHTVEVSAIHKHLQDETPRLWWVHYAGYGDPVAIAATLHAAFALTGMPLNAPAETETPIPLDTAALDRVIGVKGETEHGAYHFHIPVAKQITDTRAHLTLPTLMEASTLLMFQPLGADQAAINGDFAMTADQVNPVIHALQAHGITIISLHNHLLYESPRLFYMHFWGAGGATTLAQGLRAGLDATTH